MAEEKIFISYSRKDKEVVNGIKEEIENSTRQKCWIDLQGIDSDKKFVDIIIKAINEADVFLFMYSKNSAASEWTKKELAFAEMKKKHIVFMNIDKSPLDDWFIFQYSQHDMIDFDVEDQRNKLIRNIREWCGVPEDDVEPEKELSEEEKFMQEYISKGFEYQAGTEDAKPNPKLAFEMYQKAADMGSGLGWNILGICYMDGIGVRSNKHKAVECYKKAIELGETFGYVRLADCYINGLGVTKNINKAFELYQQMNEAGDARGEYYIGLAYYDGGVYPTPDYDIAFRHFSEASRLGVSAADVRLGEMYFRGLGMRTDHNKAYEYFDKALGEDDDEAYLYMALFYQKGWVVDMDLEKARELYAEAANRGIDDAVENLEIIEDYLNGEPGHNFRMNVIMTHDGNDSMIARGYVVSGYVRVGDEVVVVDVKHGTSVVSEVLRIQIGNHVQNHAFASDGTDFFTTDVLVILSGLDRKTLKKGFVICSKDYTEEEPEGDEPEEEPSLTAEVENTDDSTAECEMPEDVAECADEESQEAVGPVSTKAARTGLCVYMPDGTAIQEERANLTMLAALKLVDPKLVFDMHIPQDGDYLVSRTVHPKYATSQLDLGDGYLLNPHSNNKTKQRQLQMISDKLNLGWRIEII